MAKIYDEDGIIVKCSREGCGKELDTSMELEYSEEINTLCCCPDCATDVYYENMRSKPVGKDELVELGYKVGKR